MLNERIYNTGEIQLNYAVGPENGPPLLLLHGVMANWQSFRPIIPGLSQNYQLVAVDLRGHGRSGRIKQGYRLVDYSRDVLHFIPTLFKQPPIILGHSIGALVAIDVAARLPQAIPALIFLDPPLIYRKMPLKDAPDPVDQEAYHWFATMYEIMTASASIDEVERHLRRIFPDWTKEGYHNLAQRLSDIDSEVVGMLINHQHMENYDTDALLEQVKCPVLIMQGNRRRGAALADDDAAYLLTKLVQGRLVRIEDAGHNVHVTQPDRVTKEVIIFLYGTTVGTEPYR